MLLSFLPLLRALPGGRDGPGGWHTDEGTGLALSLMRCPDPALPSRGGWVSPARYRDMDTTGSAKSLLLQGKKTQVDFPQLERGFIISGTENGLEVRCGWIQVLSVIRLFTLVHSWLFLCWPPSLLHAGFLEVAGRAAIFLPAPVCGSQGRRLMGLFGFWPIPEPGLAVAIKVCSLTQSRTQSLPVAHGSRPITTETGRLASSAGERAATMLLSHQDTMLQMQTPPNPATLPTFPAASVLEGSRNPG